MADNKLPASTNLLEKNHWFVIPSFLSIFSLQDIKLLLIKYYFYLILVKINTKINISAELNIIFISYSLLYKGQSICHSSMSLHSCCTQDISSIWLVSFEFMLYIGQKAFVLVSMSSTFMWYTGQIIKYMPCLVSLMHLCCT